MEDMIERLKMQYKAAIIGASGFAGAELARILLGHPCFELAYAVSDSYKGQKLSDIYQAFMGFTDLTYVGRGDVDFTNVDVAFLAVPHTAALKLAPMLIDKGVVVIDLSADFRLRDAGVYEKYYKVEHTQKKLLKIARFGLPELEPMDIQYARESFEKKEPVLVACAGCYPTAVSIAGAPTVRAGIAVSGSTIVADAISGVTGAGRTPSERTHFCTANENLSVYGILEHRHTPEMEQILGFDGSVLFTPHLAPIDRGILATVTMKVEDGMSAWNTERLLTVYSEFYGGCQFVDVLPEGSLPSTKAVRGTNHAQVSVAYSERTGCVLAICAIDNLCKGAAGQAVQCANVVFGFDEETGLENMAVPI